MTEENNKPKATLIKHVVTPSENKEEQTLSPKEVDTKPKAPEKRRVVVVKKKVVVVKPQARPEVVSSAPASSNAPAPESKPVTQNRTSTLRKTVRSTGDRINSSPLHTGPVVIRPTNLPPVPNQGQTVKDHAEWQSKNPDGVAPTPAPASTGPRIAGTVGGRPAPGSRPPYQGNRTGGGYQGNSPRPNGGSTGGYQGSAPRTGGYQG
ncbi:MAG: translation initiation factor IF-2, partial [Sphaerochaeta sp.]